MSVLTIINRQLAASKDICDHEELNVPGVRCYYIRGPLSSKIEVRRPMCDGMPLLHSPECSAVAS